MLLMYNQYMAFFNDFINLFTGFRRYNFIPKRTRARPQMQKHLYVDIKTKRKKFMSKHRYTHTKREWKIWTDR